MDTEKGRKLFTEYPYHIAMLVKVAQQAIKEGRVRIKDGKLVANSKKTDNEHPETNSGSDGK